MIRRLGFILFIHLMFTLGVCFAYDCFVDTENYQCRLGMKTPYRFVANYNVSQFKYPGCTEKKIWLIVRHGTRYLKDKYILRLTKDLPKMRNIILENSKAHKTSLSLDDVDKFEQWKFNLSRNYSMSLMEEGENEMIGLGTRFQSRFPLLMPRRYSNETYKFKYTDTARTRDSAIYFTIGLFGPHGSQSVHYPETEKEDPVLRFYKKCPRWEMEINDNPSTLEEQNKFSNTTEFKAMLDRISQRLGYDVDYETVNSMFMMCGFATAWDAKTESPWCNVFSLEDFKVLEFMTDLKHYWKDGYGYNLTYEQACVALLDMFNSFTSDDLPTTTVYFTHSGTILKLLSLLGIGKDPFTLTHDQYAAHKDDRAWRASIIDAFGSNIAFVSYECESEGPSILVMHQERVVTLPQCPKDRPCPLSTMKALFPDRDEECEFEEMCRL